MNDLNYTPGPWHPINFSGYWQINDGPFYEDASVLDNDNFECAEANCRLAAAGPELYEALKTLIHLHGCEMEGISSGMPTPKMWMEAVDKAETAVLKAEGKQQTNQ